MSANTIVILAEFLIFKAAQSQYYYGHSSYPTYYSEYFPSYYAQPYSSPPEAAYTRPDSISAQTPSNPPYATSLPTQPATTRTVSSLDPASSYSYTVPSTSSSYVPSSTSSSYPDYNHYLSSPSLVPVTSVPYPVQPLSTPSSLPPSSSHSTSTVSYPTQPLSIPPYIPYLPPYPSSVPSSSPPGSHPDPNPHSPYLSPNSETEFNTPIVPYPYYQYPQVPTTPSSYSLSVPSNTHFPLSNYTYTYPYLREEIPTEAPVYYPSYPYSTAITEYKQELPPPVYNCPFCNGFKDVKPPTGKKIPLPPPPTATERRQDCHCKHEQRDFEPDYVYRYAENPGISQDTLPRQYLYTSQENQPHVEYQQCPENQRYQHPDQYQKLEDQQYRPILSYSDYENRMIPTYREEKKPIPKPQELFKTLIAEIENRIGPKLKKSVPDTKLKCKTEEYQKVDKYGLIPKEYDLQPRCHECSKQSKEDTRCRRERSGLPTSEPSSRRLGFNQPPTFIDPNYFEDDAFYKYSGESTPVRNSRPDLELLDAFLSCLGKP